MSRRDKRPPPAVRARFAARIDALSALGNWLRVACERYGESDAWLDAFELAAVEASSNVMRHGHSASCVAASDAPVIALTLRCWQDFVALDVFDAGPAPPPGLFDAPASLPSVDPANIDALPEGGMGLGIMHASVDVIEHRRRLGVNRLRLVKHRSGR
ncbi:hypothetical protein BLA23254_07481 [Burkholderia lata]|uniref:Histidine kinase/HSP90-like ATPase domain-containing protein n=1 Tax=Burkholderia lata (strain ATCC 17760 / DSM 23089 / LMG 22485 / NCIMB 9086 / R18194 / 383) TaxID=482957 RepID=A0A6P2SBF7_BURL3|nr:ATP-binding protein [Burkholderia lata]VWC47478.1 hypothetical protein BLA23254_07481 [Burkholderia lata]